MNAQLREIKFVEALKAIINGEIGNIYFTRSGVNIHKLTHYKVDINDMDQMTFYIKEEV